MQRFDHFLILRISQRLLDAFAGLLRLSIFEEPRFNACSVSFTFYASTTYWTDGFELIRAWEKTKALGHVNGDL